MCATIDNIIEKPSGLSRELSKATAGFDPLMSAMTKFDADSIRDVSNNPYGRAIGTGVAGYFGGPWGAALAQSAMSKEAGNSWGQSLTNGALAGGMAYAAGAGGGGSDAGASGSIDYGDGTAFAGGEGAAYSAPAAGSSQATWDQPATDYGTGSSFEGTGASEGAASMPGATPDYTNYDTGAVDLTGSKLNDLTQTSGDPSSFSIKDWLKGDGSKTGQFGRMQMIQGGLKTLGGIQDYQAKNKQADDLMARYNQQNAALDQYYAAGSPEAKAMEEQLARQDAAAGRRSQYGTRATNLAAQLAQTRANYRAQMAPGLNQLYNQAGQLRGSAPAGMWGGASQALTGYALSSMF